MKPLSTALRAFALATTLLAAVPAWTADDISAAEKLLFATDHLAALKPGTPTLLRYRFDHAGSLEQAYNDSVELTLSPAAKGGRNATARFLSGTREFKVSPVEQPDGNPVLLHFLERDIREMERLTGGKPNYFRKRIRIALAEGAEVRPATIRWGGRTLEARAVRITPYAGDPLKERFGRHVGKVYEFTFARDIPGQLWQVHTRTPDPERPDGPPLIDETLRFDGSAPAPGGSASAGAAQPAPGT